MSPRSTLEVRQKILYKAPGNLCIPQLSTTMRQSQQFEQTLETLANPTVINHPPSTMACTENIDNRSAGPIICDSTPHRDEAELPTRQPDIVDDISAMQTKLRRLSRKELREFIGPCRELFKFALPIYRELHGDDWWPFVKAAISGDVELLELCTAHGAVPRDLLVVKRSPRHWYDGPKKFYSISTLPSLVLESFHDRKLEFKPAYETLAWLLDRGFSPQWGSMISNQNPAEESSSVDPCSCCRRDKRKTAPVAIIALDDDVESAPLLSSEAQHHEAQGMLAHKLRKAVNEWCPCKVLTAYEIGAPTEAGASAVDAPGSTDALTALDPLYALGGNRALDFLRRSDDTKELQGRDALKELDRLDVMGLLDMKHPDVQIDQAEVHWRIFCSLETLHCSQSNTIMRQCFFRLRIADTQKQIDQYIQLIRLIRRFGGLCPVLNIPSSIRGDQDLHDHDRSWTAMATALSVQYPPIAVEMCFHDHQTRVRGFGPDSFGTRVMNGDLRHLNDDIVLRQTLPSNVCRARTGQEIHGREALERLKVKFGVLQKLDALREHLRTLEQGLAILEAAYDAADYSPFSTWLVDEFYEQEMDNLLDGSRKQGLFLDEEYFRMFDEVDKRRIRKVVSSLKRQLRLNWFRS